MTQDLPALADLARGAAVLARFVAPGLAAASCIGVLAGWFGRSGAGWSGAHRADLAIAAIMVVSLSALRVAAAMDVVHPGGRTAFFADSALVHLVAYLAGAVLGIAAARIAHKRPPAVSPPAVSPG